MAPRIHAITGARLYFLPVRTRVPLKFGPEVLTFVTCARVCLTVADASGRQAKGWGETPLSVQWVWPSSLPYEERHLELQGLCRKLGALWMAHPCQGHPLWIGNQFNEQVLPKLLRETNAGRTPDKMVPLLAGLVCNAPFDLALHDAYGQLAGRPTYDTYGPESIEHDLADFFEDDKKFAGRFPSDYLVHPQPTRLTAWHLVGGLDPLTCADLNGSEPNDGYPVLLEDWITGDGLTCLKVKLRGTDAGWDYDRLVAVSRIARAHGVLHLSADFNCTVKDPGYVCQVLDRLAMEEPEASAMLLYVEQPFGYELEPERLNVRAVSERKALFLDESAHNWRMVRLGRELGWTGVALKTCKTQTGAILSGCWAKQHGMSLMVQDLTNPMLAQIPHLLLAGKLGTIMGVETNSMQFYPEASLPEAKVHPGAYRRIRGEVDLSTIVGAGFGYRLEAMQRSLPEPVALWQE